MYGNALGDWSLLDQVKAWGLVLEPAQRRLLERYLELLYAANQRFNLTCVPPEQAVGRHLVDSLVLLAVDSPPQGAQVLDLGTGAGLPGIPLKIARPDLRLTLLDSHGKTIAFLQEVCAALNLSEVQIVQARAEEWAHHPDARERFDRVVARAVARMPLLAELMLPYVKVGGVALALKSATEREEIEEARPAVERLGATMEPIEWTLHLESGAVTRLIVRMEKHAPCDARYPRRWSQMLKHPLGGTA
jgi:16S rRNA (guanine527-N7)-methyltransferase